MKARCLIMGLLAVVVATMAGCVGDTPSNPPAVAPEIKLSQTIIDSAVADCQDKTSWGINLAVVRVNYMEGAGVESAIVLHNGDDFERQVTLYYQPIKAPTLEKETGIYYDPAPIEAYGWVTIDTKSLRLSKMETEVVRIHLLVPKSYKIPSKNWEFDIIADGTVINVDQQVIDVVTEASDTALLIRLPQPLLQDSILNVASITSSIDESPYATSYDPSNRMLTIEGLKELEIRELTLTYEYGSMVTVAYMQRWLITMLSG